MSSRPGYPLKEEKGKKEREKEGRHRHKQTGSVATETKVSYRRWAGSWSKQLTTENSMRAGVELSRALLA